MNMKLLCTRMPSFQKYQIRACLNELEREGKVYFSKESGYALCSRLGIVSGTVVKVAIVSPAAEDSPEELSSKDRLDFGSSSKKSFARVS